MIKNKERLIGIELLRIISMIFVLLLHFLLLGGYLQSNNIYVNIESWFAYVFSLVAVNCYVLITGYFMCDKSFKLSRITLVYSQVWFYSICIFVFTVLLGIVELTKSNFANAILPFVFKHYWFVLNYVLLLLVSPILNSATRDMNKNKHKCVLFVLISIFSFLNYCIKPLNPVIDGSGGFGLGWFIILYLSSAYIKKYPNRFRKKLKWTVLYISFSIFTFVIHLFTYGKGKVWEQSMVRDYNNTLIYLAAVSLFVVFLNIRLKTKLLKRIILFISPLTLAVYLIHESPFISGWLWSTINVNTWCINNALFIFQAIGTVICIFIICCFIELIRSMAFKVLRINYAIVKASDFFETKIRYFITK